MKYLAIDLETSSGKDLNRSPDRILMASFVVEDTKQNIPVEQLPHFTCLIDQPFIHGEPTALAMNAWILVALEYSKSKANDFVAKYIELGIPVETISKAMKAATAYPVLTLADFELQVATFLTQHFGTKDRITIAGKNVTGFDLQFLPIGIQERFRRNAIDWGMLFWKPLEDRQVPGSAEVMKRAGIEFKGAHDALEDNRMGIAAARTLYKRLTCVHDTGKVIL